MIMKIMQNICIAGSTGTSKQDQSLRAEVTDVRREEERRGEERRKSVYLLGWAGEQKTTTNKIICETQPTRPDGCDFYLNCRTTPSHYLLIGHLSPATN